ncbi:MAG: exo-alpha-sialidase [Phycisphaerales bacterium]|nr:exo-alpha-sialidase [Phycisphaerales bacterium]
MPQGLGVVRTDNFAADLAPDNKVTWQYHVKGIEEMVVSDVIAPPGGKPIVALWDRTAFVIHDPDTYTATQVHPEQFSTGWDVTYRPNDPRYIAVVSTNHQDNANYSRYSTDGGLTWQPFDSLANKTHPTNLRYGSIAAAYSGETYPNSLVWVTPFMTVPYYSLDGGATWQASNWIKDEKNKLIPTGFWNQYFRWQGLIADPWQEGAYFMHVKIHEGNAYLARSVDGGKNWSIVSKGELPLYGHHAHLRANPDVQGHLWYANGVAEDQRGLWRSVNAGVTFEQLINVDAAAGIALGKAAPGSHYATLFLIGIVGGQEGVYRSTDEGATWDFLTQFPLGYIDQPWSISGDWDQFGVVYLGIGGSSFVIGREIIPEPSALGMMLLMSSTLMIRQRSGR